MRRIDELFTAWPFLGSRRMTRDAASEGVRQPQAGAAADAADGDRGARAEAEHDEAGAGPQDLSLSAARPDDRPAEPGLGGRHHLHPDRARLSLPGGDHRLGEPGGSGLAAVEHDGRLVLRRGARGGAGALRQAGDLQHRPGLQFTSAAFTGALAAPAIAISMDGRGRWMDNVFIERLWRSLKYEDIYLKGYADGREAKAGIAEWIAFYNDRRPHQALGYRTPMAVWREAIAGAGATRSPRNPRRSPPARLNHRHQSGSRRAMARNYRQSDSRRRDLGSSRSQRPSLARHRGKHAQNLSPKPSS